MSLVLAGLCLACPLLAVGQDKDGREREAELSQLLNTQVEVGSKFLENLSESPGVISVLTRDDLMRFGGTTLADVLNRVPGLLVVSSFFGERTMVVAPGDNVSVIKSNMHILVLIDGRPVREVQEGGIKSDVFEAFPVEIIDHIEVVKGPGSVLYGSEAFSGVINVVTRKAEPTGGSLAATLASKNAYSHSGLLSVTKGDFSMTAAAQKARTPDWELKYDFSPMPLIENLNAKTEKDGAVIRSNYKDLSFTSSFLKFRTPYFIPFLGLACKEELQKGFADLGYSCIVNQNWRLSAHFTYNRSWFETFRFVSQSPIAIPFKRDSNEKLLEVTNFFNISDNFLITLGGLYSRSEGREWPLDGQPVRCDASRDGTAFYAQASYKVGGLKFIGGCQSHKVSDLKLTVVPRLGILWDVNEKINAKLLYGEAFRAPYLNENYIYFPFFIMGDKSLKPEMMKTLQCSLTYNGPTSEIRLSGIEARHSDIIGYVPANDPMDPYLNVYINKDKFVVRGVELEGKYYASRSFYFVGSLLAQQTPEGELTGYSNFGAKAGVCYMSRYGVISLFNVHQGGLSSRLDNPQSSNPKAGAYDLLNLHARLDVNAVFRLNQKIRWEACLQGDNLLHKEFWPSAVAATPPSTIPYKKGQMLYLGVKASF